MNILICFVFYLIEIIKYWKYKENKNKTNLRTKIKKYKQTRVNVRAQ